MENFWIIIFSESTASIKTLFQSLIYFQSLMNVPTKIWNHEVREILGLGSFSLVFKCCNVKTGKMEAMKVYNSYNSYNRYNSIIYQGIQEIEMLRRLHCLDPDTCNIVKWTDFFYDKEKLCICFELLDQTLRDYMVDRECRSLPIPEVRSIIHQVTTALSHLNSIGIVHADLKPDNVMVVDRHQQPLKVKLINFGQAQLVSAINPDVPIQTLSYRAPEVMLGIPFNEAIDVWSLGLTATELVTGCPLYMGNDEYDQRWKFKTPEEFELDVRYHSVKELLTLDDLQELMEMDRGHQSGQHLLVDLIKRMLHLNPDERIKPAEVLQHPFFSLSVPPSSPAHVYIESSHSSASLPAVANYFKKKSYFCTVLIKNSPRSCHSLCFYGLFFFL
uniref:Protein kinase domain-containing protein n=1 Tax=Mola mola TaxID=94237 RepID=A0A3Q3VR94_MOLML